MKRTAFVMAAAVAFHAACPAQAYKDFNYAGTETQQWGTSKKENYDVAVRLVSPGLVGSRIEKIEVPAKGGDGITNYRIWLSEELRLEGKKNSPDIMTAAATVEDGKISVTLDEPYAITDKGVYVGYSFDVDVLDDASKKPVTVSESDNGNAFYIHSSRTYLAWGHNGVNLAADMSVRLSGDFHDDAVAVERLDEPGELHGEELTATVTIRNHGNQPVSSLTYELDFLGGKKSDTVKFDNPLPTLYDTDVAFTVPLGSSDEAGGYPYSICIKEVNGRPNMDPQSDGTGMAYVYPYLPEHRTLMEEYTGLWCGWCPRGVVGMDGLKETWPDRFVGVTFHKDDILSINFTIPVEDAGAPSAALDRTEVVDPYYGSGPHDITTWKEGIEKDWLRFDAHTTVADMRLEAVWADAGMTAVKAEAGVKFVRPYDNADFRIIYILVQDGIEAGEPERKWVQSNYFSGNKAYAGTDLDWWYNAPSKVSGLTFNDIAILVPDIFGIPGSLPSEIEWLKEYSDVCELRLEDAVNQEGQSLVRDKDKMRVIAAVADASTGRIINACQSGIASDTGVDGIGMDDTPVRTEYYSPAGIRVEHPQDGLYIRVRHYGDGAWKTDKMIVSGGNVVE